MRQIRTVYRWAALLSVVALSGVAAQTPDPPVVTRLGVPEPATGIPAGKGAASSGAPVTRLTTPVPTPVVPPPGGTLPGGSPAGSPELQRPALGMTGGATAPGNQPVGNSPAFDSILPEAPGTGADLNAPVGASPGSLPGVPASSPPGGEGVNAPGNGPTPLLSQPVDPARPMPPTPVPVLPLSLIYGATLLLAAGYLWYTARQAETEERQRA